MPPERPPIPTPKTRSWTLPTVLGLIIGIVGALGVVELRPQLEISPQELVWKNQPFSVPFEVKNSGYLGLYIDHVICYVITVRNSEGRAVTNGIFEPPEWERVILDRNISGTLTCNLGGQDVMGIQFDNVTSADIMVVVIYRPFEQFPRPFRHHFGFKGLHGDSWQWTKYPPIAKLKARIDKEIDAALATEEAERNKR